MKRPWFSAVILIFSIAVLIAGLSKLIQMRFESGEAYPVGSSLRPDPLGSKVLFESFATQPQLSVERNFAPFNQLKELPSDAVLLLLNVWGWSIFELAEYEPIKEFVEQGGRMVIGMNSDHVAYRFILEESDETGKESDSDESEDAEEETQAEDAADPDSTFRRTADSDEAFLWGDLSLIHGKREENEVLRTDEAPASLPDKLPWRKGGALEGLDEDWTPLYRVEDEVVAAERKFGNGSLVVLTDDYLFSNEGLLKHRHSSLLLWVLGDKRTVIFDETHLGVAESVGIASLIRRYRLSGFFMGLFLFMFFVVWRGASPLLPAHAVRGGENIIFADHSSDAGLGDLVRRSVPLSKMPAEAFRIWKAAFVKSSADKRHYSQELAEIETVLSENATSSALKNKPLETHLKIKSIINRKKRKRL